MDRKRFPLLRLPIVVLTEILQIMTCVELFSFSLCSKKTKNIGKIGSKQSPTVDVNFDWRDFHFRLGNGISITLRFGSYDVLKKRENNLVSEFVTISGSYSESIGLFAPNTKPVQWINHLRNLFGIQTIIQLNVSNGLFNPDSILNAISGLKIEALAITHRGPKAAFMEGISEVLIAEQLMKHYSKNVTALLGGRFPSLFLLGRGQVTMDEILICNCEHLHLLETSLTDKDINRLLKLWMRNVITDLRSIYLTSTTRKEAFDQFMILDGISYDQLFKAKFGLAFSHSPGKQHVHIYKTRPLP
ncbi:unnamed protein product [Caenorhabditis nigoni]